MGRNVFSFLIILFFSFNLFAAGSIAGKFTIVKGHVLILRGANKLEAKMGDTVVESDTIEADATGVARITMIDSNLIDIYPKSKVAISKYVYTANENKKNVELNVSYGKIKSTVNQKYDGSANTYQVKTPSVVAGVRGTVFTTAYDPVKKTSEVITVMGLVAVARSADQRNGGAPIYVRPNQKIIDNPNIPKHDAEDLKPDERKKLKDDDTRLGIPVDLTNHPNPSAQQSTPSQTQPAPPPPTAVSANSQNTPQTTTDPNASGGDGNRNPTSTANAAVPPSFDNSSSRADQQQQSAQQQAERAQRQAERAARRAAEKAAAAAAAAAAKHATNGNSAPPTPGSTTGSPNGGKR